MRGGDAAFDRDKQHVAEQAEGPVVDLGRPMNGTPEVP